MRIEVLKTPVWLRAEELGNVYRVYLREKPQPYGRNVYLLSVATVEQVIIAERLGTDDQFRIIAAYTREHFARLIACHKQCLTSGPEIVPFMTDPEPALIIDYTTRTARRPAQRSPRHFTIIELPPSETAPTLAPASRVVDANATVTLWPFFNHHSPEKSFQLVKVGEDD